MADIHATAIIHPGAELGEGTSVGPYTVIGPHVKVGKSNHIGPHVVIEGHTSVGDGNEIFQFASVGAKPQDLKYRGEASRLEIGNRNLIREFVTLQPGTSGGGMLTKIGDGNLFMANCHVGHDCIIGDGNVIANSAAIAGHVTIGNFVTIGGLAAIHQFARVGNHAFLGAGAMVTNDAPPFCIVEGNRAGLVGLNVIGMQRRGFGDPDIEKLKRLYRKLFMGKGALRAKLEELRGEATSFAAGAELMAFIDASTRGICSPRKRTVREGE